MMVDKLPRLLREDELAEMRAMSMERHGLGIYQYTLKGVITYIDRVTLDIFDLTEDYPDPSVVIGKEIKDLIVYTAKQGSVRERVQDEGHFFGHTYHYKTLKGDDRWCLHDAYMVQHPETGQDLVHIVLRDITELKLAEESQKILQEQLYQAQKMEAIGLLTGGIAHDFNNILQVIISSGEIAILESEAGKQVMKRLEEVVKAGKRAKALVAQLLAYSRQQLLETRVLNLRDHVHDMLQMLKRIIGETVTLRFISEDDGLVVKADPGQLGQILTNLCVNARDAMSGRGVITIEATKERISDDYCKVNSWASPGEYIVLAISDTGCGMSRETLSRIFEPFFTTKEVGQGSGLGLSTVYGIVKQHHGFTNVYSEIGQGTTFRVYLPHVNQAVSAATQHMEKNLPTGTETILVAEDDDAVRMLTCNILEHAGYQVIEARDGLEAVERFKKRHSEINLLLFDVIMPCLGGPDAYAQIRQSHPDVKVLFTSGYSMNAIYSNFELHDGVMLLRKPAGRRDILEKVRVTLDS